MGEAAMATIEASAHRMLEALLEGLDPPLALLDQPNERVL
jgi:hypothetical protein